MPIAIIQGSGDVGSAVAHQLTLEGFQAIIVDDIAPAHARRGMSFVDAFYEDTALLSGVRAHYTDDISFTGAQEVLVSSCDVAKLLTQLSVDLVIDARMRKRMLPELPAWKAQHQALLIGLGPGFEVGNNCDLAIETAWGGSLGESVRSSTKALAGHPKPIEGYTRERIVYAPQAGQWNTQFNVGDVVKAGEILGDIEAQIITAPLSGRLRGISHGNAQVSKAQKIIEIDPSHLEQIYGIGERPMKIAQGIIKALHTRK